ncbi:penicillin-binding protein 2 [Spiribacter sp. 218]|uniref:penicillin-binding protein 2 n=1 Tax=Spiribacter pallidus TaxID=1987936 RepID=UPI00349F446F
MSLELLRDKTGEKRIVRGRIGVVAVLVAAAFFALAARISYLQVIEYDHFAARSQDNRVRLAPLTPTRGLIRDRDGRILAENRPAFRLTVIPEQVDDMPGLLSALGEVVELDPKTVATFRDTLRRARSFQEVPLKARLSQAEVAALSVNRHRFPGVEVRPHLARHYPHGPIGSHVVGYVGRISESELRERDPRRYRGTSVIGKSGVERWYEDRLRGEMGLARIETNALGRSLETLERQAPQPGEDLQLSLDIELQSVAADALGDHRGAIVAMAPRSGEILALTSRPGFDPNALADGLEPSSFEALRADPDQPLFNRALRGRYPPGSVVKPFLALAAAAAGVIDPDETMFCNGRYHLPNVERTWRDWKPEGHGRVDFIQAVAQSCDIYFYDLAYRMGIDAMHEWMTRFGFGRLTGIDLPGERQGVMPSRAWKRRNLDEPWYHGETVNTGIGQGFTLVTPIQMAASTAILANRGEAVRPSLLLGDNDQASPIEPLRLDDESLWQVTIDSMVETVHGRQGTARAIGRELPYQIAGKTGTAQVIGIGQDEEYDEDALDERFHDHALFTAFAPVADPRISVAVVVENGGSGSQTAAPMARTVIDAWIRQLEDEGELVTGRP